MMIYGFLILLVTHWIADFVLQTHWQASNKSKNNYALARHVASYTLLLGIVSAYIFNNRPGRWLLIIEFVILNGLLHFITDYFTSRASSKLYAKQDWHNFFVVIGFDQLIHQFTLALTMIWFFP